MLILQNRVQLRDFNPVLERYFDPTLKEFSDRESFMWLIGGDMKVLQDQHEVDAAMKELFDFFDYHPDSKYWIGIVINNNSGGPTYLIDSRFDVSKRHDPPAPDTTFDDWFDDHPTT